MSDNRALLIVLFILLAQVITAFFCSSQIVGENHQYLQSNTTYITLQDRVNHLENLHSQLTSLSHLQQFVNLSTQLPINRQIDLTIPLP